MSIIFLFVDLIVLFFVVRYTTKELFLFLLKFTGHKKFAYSVITFFFFPGTILHELAHFIAATILFLRVREIRVFPEFKDNYIRLGSVLYEKKDFVRGILVGIAPVFAGFIFFFAIFYLQLFPSKNMFINIFIIYLIFCVASTMFSSRQDLVDMVYIIPLLLIIWFCIYIFGIDINFFSLYKNIPVKLLEVFDKMNLYLLLAVFINLTLVILLKLISIFKK